MGTKRSYGYCKLASLRMRVCECQGTSAGFSRGDVEGDEGAKSARGVQPTHVFCVVFACGQTAVLDLPCLWNV